jgi:hypothetical protein
VPPAALRAQAAGCCAGRVLGEAHGAAGPSGGRWRRFDSAPGDDGQPDRRDGEADMGTQQEQEHAQQTRTQGQDEKPKPRRLLYPYGSASAERDDAIAVLGALKVATATQIMRLVRPHLTDNKSIRNALLDLSKHGLAISEGNTAGPRGRIGTPDRRGPAAQKLWRLTAAGLDYADQTIDRRRRRRPRPRGGPRRGQARDGRQRDRHRVRPGRYRT